MPHETPPLAETNITPDLESNLNHWQERLDLLEAEVDTLAGTNRYPEWWYEDTERLRTVVPQLKEEGVDLANVSRYFDLSSKEASLKARMSGRPLYNHPIKHVAYELGEDLLGRAFKAEPTTGSMHTAMLEHLAESAEAESKISLTPELTILKHAYGYQTMTELLGVGGDEYSDQLRSLLHRHNPIHWMRYNEEELKPEFTWKDMQDASQKWMGSAIAAVSGVTPEEAANYAFTASRRRADEDIVSVIQKFDHFGTDRIRLLSSKPTSIHGLEGYSIQQLERMEALITNPQEAERLAGHDVTVVLINRFGDGNGILHDVAADYDDDAERVILLEFKSFDDIPDIRSFLEDRKIKASNIVLAAHSAPGQFMVSDVRERGARHRDIATIAGRRLVEMVQANNELEPGDRGYSMHGMGAVADFIDQEMQPSRAIDDPDADKGRVKVIFQACHAATEDPVNELNEQGKKTQVGMESVISQLGKELVASGVKTNVDIYGAPGGIQMHRTDLGMRYSSNPTEGTSSRAPQQAVRIRIENGTVVEQKVDEIILRKAA